MLKLWIHLVSPDIIFQGRGGVVGPVGIIGPNGSAVSTVMLIKDQHFTFILQ